MNTIYHIAPRRSGHGFVQSMIREWLPDGKIQDMENARFRQIHEIPLVGSVVVLQIRDLLNWIASYMMSYLRKNTSIETFDFEEERRHIVKLWRRIAYEYYGITHHVPISEVFHVSYDEFFESLAARQLLCQQLGGIYTENRLNKVNPGGCGSSFNGTEYDGHAQEMPTLTRYAQVPERMHRFYHYIFKKDPELLQFYIQHQNPDEQKMRFLNKM